jgi:hypothetical protein
MLQTQLVSLCLKYQDDYDQKGLNFISQNNPIESNSNIAKNFQKDVRKIINESQQFTHNDSKWKCIHLNTSTPTIRSLIKTHKIEAPIRPIVNWRKAPAYKLPKMFSEKVKTYIHIPYVFNVTTNTHLIKNLTDIPYDQNL